MKLRLLVPLLWKSISYRNNVLSLIVQRRIKAFSEVEMLLESVKS